MPLVFTLIALCTQLAHSSISPKAKACIDNFFKAYDQVVEYSVIIQKIETSPKTGMIFNNQRIKLTHKKPNYVQVEFLDKGQTGIKNNGMIAEYDGSRALKIKLGKPEGIGSVMNHAAKIVIGDSLDLYSSYVTEREYFTLNNTSFSAFVKMLRRNLDEIAASTIGGLETKTGNSCQLTYSPHVSAHERVFSGISELSRAEEELGSMAIFWVFLNLDKFRDVSELYSRFPGKKIRISSASLPFELTLNDQNLPVELRFFHKKKEVASYHYEYLKVSKK